MAVSVRFISGARASAVAIAICLIQPSEAFCPILSQEHQAPACIARAIAESDGRTARSNFVDGWTGRRKSADNESNWTKSAVFSHNTRA